MVEVGTSNGVRFVVEKEAIDIPELNALPYFPYVLMAFALGRLVRPIVMIGAFGDSPHIKDAGVVVALICTFLASALGVLGGLLIMQNVRSFWLKMRQKVSRDAAVEQYDIMALGVLALCAFCEMLFELISVISWQYFWSTGLVTNSPTSLSSGSATASVLVVLHVAGLLGTLVLIGLYARNYYQSWHRLRKFQLEALPTVSKTPRSLYAEPERPAGRGKRVAPEQVPAPSTSDKDLKPGPRQAADPSSSSSQPPPSAEAEVKPRTKDRPPRPSAGGAPSRGGPSNADSPPFGARVRSSSSSPPGAMPRAWYWAPSGHSGEWIRVRILRSNSSDGTATVRLPGGEILTVRHAFLRPRNSSDDEPPPAPPPTQTEGRPSSARQGTRSANQRGPSKERPSSAHSPSATQGKGRCFAREEPPDPGQLWAQERMAKLRKELQELDGLSPPERRVRIRALQRELHPDKLPEDLRQHAQPLFLLVQKEWEVDQEARASGAAAS